MPKNMLHAPTRRATLASLHGRRKISRLRNHEREPGLRVQVLQELQWGGLQVQDRLPKLPFWLSNGSRVADWRSAGP